MSLTSHPPTQHDAKYKGIFADASSTKRLVRHNKSRIVFMDVVVLERDDGLAGVGDQSVWPRGKFAAMSHVELSAVKAQD